MSSQVPDPSSTTFIEPLAPAIGGPPALLPSQPSSNFLSSTASVGIQLPDSTAAQYESSSQTTNILSSTNHLQIQPPCTRKRKAPTMSKVTWKDAENRIKELWVDEEKPLVDLRDVVNSEFNFTAK